MTGIRQNLEVQRKLALAMANLETYGYGLLRMGEYKGQRQKPNACPVSRYLTAQVGVTISIGDAYAVHLETVGGHTAMATARVELSPVVSELVRRFDEGLYPELEEEPNHSGV